MAIANSASLPLAIAAFDAGCNEVSLVLPLLGDKLTSLPHRLVGDRLYRTKYLKTELAAYRILLITPPGRPYKRKKGRHQKKILPVNKEVALCLKKRWPIERLFAWLQNFRRLVTRYEYHLLNFEGLLFLGCIMIYLRHI